MQDKNYSLLGPVAARPLALWSCSTTSQIWTIPII